MYIFLTEIGRAESRRPVVPPGAEAVMVGQSIDSIYGQSYSRLWRFYFYYTACDATPARKPERREVRRGGLQYKKKGTAQWKVGNSIPDV